jgi:hypothetical protein
MVMREPATPATDPERQRLDAAVRVVPSRRGLGWSLTSRIDGAGARLLLRGENLTWSVLHVLGAHRWREGYETDLERGWTRYRGSRCVICDAPWEGW